MRVYASYNIKGGVGKTAAAVNLAYLAAREGHRTLLWDLDPQGAASFYLRVKPKRRGGAKRLMRGKRHPGDLIRESDYRGLDLLRAHFDYRHLDLILAGGKHPRTRIRRVLGRLADDYDRVFLDCPPGITLAAESVFRAAQALLVPTIPTTLSLRTLDQLESYLREEGPRRLPVMPFYSMVDARKSLQRRICEETPGARGFLETRIPYASAVEQMGVRRAPVAICSPRSAATRAFAELWREIEGRVPDP